MRATPKDVCPAAYEMTRYKMQSALRLTKTGLEATKWPLASQTRLDLDVIKERELASFRPARVQPLKRNWREGDSVARGQQEAKRQEEGKVPRNHRETLTKRLLE